MREFFQAALDEGLNLASYEAAVDEYQDPSLWMDKRLPRSGDEREIYGSSTWNRFREKNQAQHLIKIFASLPADQKMLVWCGNGHLGKVPAKLEKEMGWGTEPFVVMGCHFRQLSGVDPFCIDQTSTAEWPGSGIRGKGRAWLTLYKSVLESMPMHCGGLLTRNLQDVQLRESVDALIFSTDNDFE